MIKEVKTTDASWRPRNPSKRVSTRRHETVDILIGVFDSFLMILKIPVVDFLSHAALVPFLQNFPGVALPIAFVFPPSVERLA